jgi:hypothetical protein
MDWRDSDSTTQPPFSHPLPITSSPAGNPIHGLSPVTPLTTDIQQFPPSLLAYPEPTDFDYGAFLQTPDALSFGNDASSGGAGGFSDHSAKDATPSSDNLSQSGQVITDVVPHRQLSAQRQRLERRGHTKSRRGCYNCKRRRIKCQETHPACGHCLKTGLKCEYPSLPQITHQVWPIPLTPNL